MTKPLASWPSPSGPPWCGQWLSSAPYPSAVRVRQIARPAATTVVTRPSSNPPGSMRTHSVKPSSGTRSSSRLQSADVGEEHAPEPSQVLPEHPEDLVLG